jgi:tetratricopeptide (TPR) repeat protein
MRQADPASPDPLDAQLAYAGYLLSGVPGSSCGKRLDLAQEQIGSVAANPKTRVMFPDGWALVADLEYRQHLARAACLGKMDRRDELLAALEAARRAVTLYRIEFDYHSMVVMQFDSAVTLQQLGAEAAALAALEGALRMDREFGLREDARENYELLLTWRGEPAGSVQVASLMRDFPQRRATLEFGWHPTDARIALDRRRVCLSEGQIA